MVVESEIRQRRPGVRGVLGYVLAMAVSLFLIMPQLASAFCPSPGDPALSAAAPVAVAVDSSHQRVYVVHRQVYDDVGITTNDFFDSILPTNRVSVLAQGTGEVLAVIPVGESQDGKGQGIAVDPARSRLYVGNADEHTVSVIDTAANEVIATTAVDVWPMGIAVDSSEGKVFVAGNTDSIVVLDALTGAVSATIPLGSSKATAVVVDQASHRVFVSAWASAALFIIDSQTNAVMGHLDLNLLFFGSSTIAFDDDIVFMSFRASSTVARIDVSDSAAPLLLTGFTASNNQEAIAVDPDTHLVYVTDVAENLVNIFNAEGTKLAGLPTRRMPASIAADPASRTMYIANAHSDSVSVFDADLRSLRDTWVLGFIPIGVAYESAGRRLYAANVVADSLTVVDTLTGSAVAHWLTGPNPWAVALDEDLHQVYVTSSTGETVSIIDTVSGLTRAVIDVGKTPYSVAVSQSTHRVYVSAAGDNTLTVLDGQTLEKVATVPVGLYPVGVSVDDTGGFVYVANQQGGTISVIDMAGNTQTQLFSPPENNVWGLALDSALDRLYVSVPPAYIGDFSGLETLGLSGAFVGMVSMEGRAEQVVVDPVTHEIFVSDSRKGTVSIIDGITGALVSTVNTGLPGAIDPGSDLLTEQLRAGAHSLSVDHDAGVVYVSNPYDSVISCVGLWPQSYCANTISPSGRTFSSPGGTGSIDVTASSDSCFWTAASNASWITISSGSNGTGDGSVEYTVSANTTGVPRTGTISVAGGTFEVIQNPELPDLTPYKPAGWSASIVLSTVQGATSDSSAFSPEDTVYLSWAVLNNGTAPVADIFYVSLYLDGSFRSWWYVNPLQQNYYSYFQDFDLGSLSVGRHTIRIAADSTGVVPEDHENDNEYSRTIDVGLICEGSPVKMSDSTYATFMEPYQSAEPEPGDEIEIEILGQAVSFTEELVFNKDISVTLKGGYDCGFSAGGHKSAVTGMLTVSSGTLTIGDFIFQ